MKDEFYGGAAFVRKDYFHPSLLGKLPRGKLLCKDIIVGVNGTAVFDVNEERLTHPFDFDSVIERMRSTGPGKPLDLDVLRLSSEPIPRRVRVTKLLPKYAASSSDVIFTPQFLQNIRNELNERAGASLSTAELSIDAEDAPSDPFSIELTVAGWSDLVEETKSIIANVLHSHIICHKQNELLRSNDSIELDLRLDPRHKLGLSFDGLRSTLRRSTRGVWLNLQAGEQMNAILGQAAAALGGVLLKIGDRTVDTIDDTTNAWNSLVGGSVVVTVCIHKDADTRSINQSHLDREPRRRGGGAYRGPLRVPSAFASGSTLSGTSGSSKRKRKLSKGDGGDEKRKKTAPSGADSSGGSSRKASVSNNISLTVNEYQRFRAKMSRIFDIEFRTHGFQRSAVIKSTWSLHKSLIGDTCGDDCSCLSRLREICADVVKDHLERKQQEEGAQWTNPLKLRIDAFPIGFISRFVPKFMSLVQKEMPQTNSTEMLNVLEQMWSRHKKSYKKATCSSSCACQDDWERIFKPKVAPTLLAPPLRRQASKEDSSVASSRNAHGVVGRLRSPSPLAEPVIISKQVTYPSGATTTVLANDTKPPSAQSVAAAGKRDWSMSGEQLRRSSKAPGWAGAAATKGFGFASKRGTPLENSADDSKKTSIDPDATTKKKSHAKTGSLLLRPDRKRKTGRKVSFFRGGHEEREYVIGSSVTGRIAEDSSNPSGNNMNAAKGELASDDETGDAMSGSPTKGATLDMDVPINVRRSKKLLEAIWNGDYRDVLRLLKEGAPVSMRDKNNLAPIDQVKKKMVELESQLREAGGDDKPILKDSLADFKRKSILLKIYIHVEHNISLLWALDDWQNIQIAVDSINGLTLSPEGRRHPSSPDVFCVMVLENR